MLIFNEGLFHKDLEGMQSLPTRVTIFVDKVQLEAELFDTDCARAIGAVLPLETKPSVWGDEFYFEIPVEKALDETATTKVSVKENHPTKLIFARNVFVACDFRQGESAVIPQ
jgi:hypothetical protein